MTYLLGVIGDPIIHSLSPLIHKHWLRASGIDATYEAMQVKDGDFSQAIQTLQKRNTVGVNVTLPHKTAALDICTTASPIAKMVGAANTISFKDPNHLHADNTDVPGFLQALARAGIDDLRGETVIVLGAGGAARGVVHALAEKANKLIVLNRTAARAEALVTELGGPNSVHGSISQLTDYQSTASIIVNTTSAGHSGQILHLPEGRDRLFFDISYGKAASAQLSEAVSSGWVVEDGLGMLVAQAAESFEIWFGQRPQEDDILAHCRTLVEAVS